MMSACWGMLQVDIFFNLLVMLQFFWGYGKPLLNTLNVISGRSPLRLFCTGNSKPLVL